MNKLPPGKYFIGDPCYVIDDSKWSEFLSAFWGEGSSGGTFTFDGYKCASFLTAWGDGAYELSTGDVLYVDAGIIGAIPLSLMAIGDEADGAIVTFDETFECREDSGLITFGDVVVDTSEDEDDDCCPECGR